MTNQQLLLCGSNRWWCPPGVLLTTDPSSGMLLPGWALHVQVYFHSPRTSTFYTTTGPEYGTHDKCLVTFSDAPQTDAGAKSSSVASQRHVPQHFKSACTYLCELEEQLHRVSLGITGNTHGHMKGGGSQLSPHLLCDLLRSQPFPFDDLEGRGIKHLSIMDAAKEVGCDPCERTPHITGCLDIQGMLIMLLVLHLWDFMWHAYTHRCWIANIWEPVMAQFQMCLCNGECEEIRQVQKHHIQECTGLLVD